MLRVLLMKNERLFIGCFPTGWVFCDKAIEKQGDYLRVAYQSGLPELQHAGTGD